MRYNASIAKRRTRSWKRGFLHQTLPPRSLSSAARAPDQCTPSLSSGNLDLACANKFAKAFFVWEFYVPCEHILVNGTALNVIENVETMSSFPKHQPWLFLIWWYFYQSGRWGGWKCLCAIRAGHVQQVWRIYGLGVWTSHWVRLDEMPNILQRWRSQPAEDSSASSFRNHGPRFWFSCLDSPIWRGFVIFFSGRGLIDFGV